MLRYTADGGAETGQLQVKMAEGLALTEQRHEERAL